MASQLRRLALSPSSHQSLVFVMSRCHLNHETFTKNNRVSNMLVRSYSQYGPDYVNNTYQPEKVEEVAESGDLQYTRVKAALNNQTSSIFHDPLVTKFTNYVMKTGQKVLARDLMEKTFAEIKRIQLQKWHEAKTEEEKAKIECNPVKIFHQAVENGRPLLDLLPVKRGGIKYQVPIPMTEKRSYFVSMRWFVHAGREKERTVHFPERLARELLSAAKNEGRVIKKKHDLHRVCEANRAYAHYSYR